MSIRLIASDMDGTLLNPQTNISKANVDAIRRLERAGIEFLICSGRDYQEAKAVMDACDITCSYICLSGAAVYSQDGEILSEIPLTPQNLVDIDRILTEQQADMDILTSLGRYTTTPKERKLNEIYSFLKKRNSAPLLITFPKSWKMPYKTGWNPRPLFPLLKSFLRAVMYLRYAATDFLFKRLQN